MKLAKRAQPGRRSIFMASLRTRLLTMLLLAPPCQPGPTSWRTNRSFQDIDTSAFQKRRRSSACTCRGPHLFVVFHDYPSAMSDGFRGCRANRPPSLSGFFASGPPSLPPSDARTNWSIPRVFFHFDSIPSRVRRTKHVSHERICKKRDVGSCPNQKRHPERHAFRSFFDRASRDGEAKDGWKVNAHVGNRSFERDPSKHLSRSFRMHRECGLVQARMRSMHLYLKLSDEGNVPCDVGIPQAHPPPRKAQARVADRRTEARDPVCSAASSLSVSSKKIMSD